MQLVLGMWVFTLGGLAGTVAPATKLDLARNAVRRIRPYRTLGPIVRVIKINLEK